MNNIEKKEENLVYKFIADIIISLLLAVSIGALYNLDEAYAVGVLAFFIAFWKLEWNKYQ